MKKLATTFVMILFLSLNGFSQELKERKTERPSLTTAQRNQLQLKRMTLELDLSAKQQNEIAVIIAEQSKKREAQRDQIKKQKEAQKQLTADEKFALKNQMLDEQIAHKARMRKILNEKQYEKWETNLEKRQEKAHKMRKRHKQPVHDKNE